MTESELYWSINYAEGIIDANNDEIDRLEKEHDDMLSLNKGLGNVFSKHEEVYSKNKNAMNDSVFGTSKCMQKFKSSFIDLLDGHKTSTGSSDLSTISTRISNIKSRIEELESSNSYWRDQIDWYYQELYKIWANQNS